LIIRIFPLPRNEGNRATPGGGGGVLPPIRRRRLVFRDRRERRERVFLPRRRPLPAIDVFVRVDGAPTGGIPPSPAAGTGDAGGAVDSFPTRALFAGGSRTGVPPGEDAADAIGEIPPKSGPGPGACPLPLITPLQHSILVARASIPFP
jgi:hypothetical protein